METAAAAVPSTHLACGGVEALRTGPSMGLNRGDSALRLRPRRPGTRATGDLEADPSGA